MIIAAMMITCCRFTNLKAKDGLTELSLPKIQTDMLKDYDRQVFFPSKRWKNQLVFMWVCVCERKIIIEHWLSWWLDFFIFVAVVTWPGTWAPHPPFIEKNLHTRRWILSKSWFLSIIVHHCCLGGAKYIPGVINNVFNTRKNLDLAARIWKQNIGWQQYYFASINRLKEHVCLHIYRALPKIGNKCQCLI